MLRRVLLTTVAVATAASTPVLAAGHASPAKPGHWVAPPDDHWQGHGTDPTNPQACDPIDPAQCMLPYPNDWFTRPDPSSATGRRLDLNVLAMPRNVEGKPIEPQEWNRSDGFSAGAQILTVVPGMTKDSDLKASNLPTVTDLSANDNPDAGVVLLDTKTGVRWPVWVEIDHYTDMAGPEPSVDNQQDLMIHPARNLTDGDRYIVALRGLVADDGTPARPNPAFLAYRDGTAPATDPRTAHMNGIFDTLKQAGVGRASLYLAWDFTTASTQNVTGRLLAIRNDAFSQLGETTQQLAKGEVAGKAPSYSVDTVTDYTDAQNTKVARQITGHFTVPCYLFPTCDPPTKCDSVTQGTLDDCPTPSQFALDPTNADALPSQTPGQTYQANFICNVGRQAFEARQLMRPVEYGHGLFGSAGEVNSDPQVTMANDYKMLYCATDWTGMATADVPNAVVALSDLSRFPLLTDRVQQGELDFLYLARLLVHPQGFAANPAFQWSDHQTFIDTSGVFYDGNSQGGIFGGTVCAVSVDVRRCVLGVPGMDYSILLPRSSDYVAAQPILATDPTSADPTDPTSLVGYSDLLDTAYPDQGQRMLTLDLIQTLWDRSDPDGYATHMTGGLPNTPSHQVLLQLAYGDHQVANITAEDEARTIGAVAMRPAVVPDRFGPYADPFWGLRDFDGDCSRCSGIVIFDSGPAGNVTPQGHHGTDPPPTTDTPNRSGDDPHEAPRRAPYGQQMKAAFLAVDGALTATGGGAPYFSWGWDGVSGLPAGA